MRVNRQFLGYLTVRLLMFPFSILSISWIHRIGRFLGTVAFYTMRDYRKRALSNLSLATDLSLNKKEIFQIAKSSFQNLAINCLEYAKFGSKKDLSKIIKCDNPQEAQKLHSRGQGIIFFCGHQANWEALFLDGTTRMKGVAIGKPIRNPWLYRWIISVREKFGGKIVEPRNALREGLWALRKGSFIGIVGDQGKPDSGYFFPFFGRRAWTSTAPAFLSYRTQSPIIFAETRRVPEGYRIHYSPPLWPNLGRPIEEEVPHLMDQLLTLQQESIRRSPGEWLWQHKRWKQPDSCNILKKFSYDCLCIILPPDPEELLPHLAVLKQIYFHHFLFLIVPEKLKGVPLIESEEVIYYKHLEETLIEDYRFKLVFNFTDFKPIEKHYKKLSAFKIIDLPLLKKLAAPHLPCDGENNLSQIFKRALCRSGTFWHAP